MIQWDLYLKQKDMEAVVSVISFVLRSLSHMLEVVVPPLCAGCNKQGAYVCDECERSILWIDPYRACRMCGAPYGRLTCTCCKHESELVGVICACGSGEVSLKIVKTYKNGPEINLAPFIASAIVVALEIADLEGVLCVGLDDIDGICYIPARFSAVVKRGFDHMELVCQIASKLLNIPSVDCLYVDDVQDQRSLGKQQRLENMKDSIHVTEDVVGLNLILIDDVITTGSTILSAIKALEASGARNVIPSAFCRVWQNLGVSVRIKHRQRAILA